MTDDELLEYLGLADGPDERAWIARLLWWQREAYETMRTKEQDIKLWQEGVGPKPTGVILCKEHNQAAWKAGQADFSSRGGRVTSEAKRRTAQINGRKGGRPRSQSDRPGVECKK